MFEKLILNPYVKNALKQYMDKGQKKCSAFNSVRPSGYWKADLCRYPGTLSPGHQT